MTTRIIDVGSATLIAEGSERDRVANRVWMNVLRALSAYQMYRLDVRMRILRDSVIDYLLRDARFPRSVAHTLLQLQACVEQLPNHAEPLGAVLRVKELVAQQTVSELSGVALHGFIDDLQVELGQVHQAIARTWFFTGLDEAV
jgi:uncharacterized alpha-E superfamily protein